MEGERTVGRIGLLARQGAKNIFLKRTILLNFLGRKMSIPHIWCIAAPKTPLVSLQPGFKHSCRARRRQGCRTRYFHRKDYRWLWAANRCSEIFTLFYVESLVHWKVKASNHAFDQSVILCTHLIGAIFSLLWSTKSKLKLGLQK